MRDREREELYTGYEQHPDGRWFAMYCNVTKDQTERSAEGILWVRNEQAALTAPEAPAATTDARAYPCRECGVTRSEAEGGTTFTVCDECWDKHGGKAPAATGGGAAWKCSSCGKHIGSPGKCIACHANSPAATAPAEAGEVKPHCCVCDSGIVTCWVDAKAHNREVARRVKAEQDYNGLLVQFGEGLDSAHAYVHEHNNEEPFYSGLGRHVWTLILKDAKKQRHRAENAEAEAAALRETVAECRALIARPYNAVYDLVEDLDAALRDEEAW